MSSDAGEGVTSEGEQREGLVPKRRFPEFRDAGEWQLAPLRSLAKRKTKRNASEEVVRVLTNSAEHGVIDQKDYFEKDIAVQGNLETYFVVNRGDYVYNPRISSMAPVGPIGKNKVGVGVMSPLYTVFGFNTEDDGFYEQFFRTSLWHGHMRLVSNSGARHDRMAIATDDFMNMPIPAPSTAEQQKIADCLTSLDAVIAAERERLALLRKYKKGLMQALFPAPGQTTPRLRFPEFQDAGEWEERTLAHISPAIFDGTHQTPTYVEDGVPFFSVENLVSGAANRFISKADHDLATAKNKPEIGDLLVTRIGKIGFSKIIDWESEFSIYVTLAVIKKSSAFDTGYLHSFVQSERYQTELAQRSLLNAVPCKINMDELRRSLVLLPSRPEQKRIADCFYDCDRNIDAQTDMLKALKAHKSGLMQQLFPSPTAAAE